jgi:Zn-dependent protease
MNFSDGIIWYLVFIFSTVVHEASHASIAFKFGDSTAYNSGQVSLNPIPHMKREPFGTIIIPIISFLAAGWMIGWASTPYNHEWANNNPKKAAMMAAAGPISNLLLIIVTALIIHLGMSFGMFYPPSTVNISSLVASTETGILESVAKLLSIMFSLNLILFIFNMLPVPPLDGSGIPPIFLSVENGKRYMNLIRNPGFTFIGLFAAWKLFDLVYFQIYLFTLNILYPGSNYR